MDLEWIIRCQTILLFLGVEDGSVIVVACTGDEWVKRFFFFHDFSVKGIASLITPPSICCSFTRISGNLANSKRCSGTRWHTVVLW